MYIIRSRTVYMEQTHDRNTHLSNAYHGESSLRYLDGAMRAQKIINFIFVEQRITNAVTSSW